MKPYLLVFLTSVALSALLTWVVRELAKRFGIVPKPDARHHIHSQPIPRLGGVAIFVTFCCFVVLLHIGSKFGLFPSPLGKDPFKILVPAVLLFAVGIFDDIKALRARTKLAIQLCGAVWLCWSGLCFPDFTFQVAGISLGHVLSLSMTVCWVIWVCNGINFIDGLDGLAAGTSFLLAAPILVVAVLTGRTVVGMAATALAGTVLGFLIFNFNPATIFLGDSGSLFLGFVLSGLVLAETRTSEANFRSIAMPLVAFALPLTDTALSALRRMLSGRPLFSPDRKHIHHRLLDMGFTQRQAVGILYGVTTVCVALSLTFLPRFGVASLAASGIGLVIIILGVQQLGYQEFREVLSIEYTMQRCRRSLFFTINTRKTAAKLAAAKTLQQLMEVLEMCLRQDFSGLELILNPRFCQARLRGVPKSGMLRRFWDPATKQSAGLTLELNTLDSVPLGSLRVYRTGNAPLLDDLDVLAEELGNELSAALARILGQATDEIEKPGEFAGASRQGLDTSRDGVSAAAAAAD